MKRFQFCLLLFAILSLPAAGDPPQGKKKEEQPLTDQKSLQGKWQAVRMIWSGDRIPAKSIEKLQLEITKHWYLTSGGPIKWLERGKHLVEAKLPEMDAVWEIDQTKNPKTIVLYQPQRDLAYRMPNRGIYKLEGDMLTVCFGSFGKPPASFDDKDALQIAVYKRIPQPKAPAAK